MKRAMKDEKGIAMVLAITLTGLLSSLGLYLIMESGTSYRITKAMVRSESALNLADGGTQLGMRCINRNTPSPGFQQLTNPTIQPIGGLPSYMTAPLSLGGGTIARSVDYVGYNTTPPPGWMLNWQGYSSFHSLHYRSRGQASIPLPASQGNAQSNVSVLALKVTR